MKNLVTSSYYVQIYKDADTSIEFELLTFSPPSCMILAKMEKVMIDTYVRRIKMESTNEFVQKLHEKQKKDEQNRKRQGNHDPSSKLPTNRDKG